MKEGRGVGLSIQFLTKTVEKCFEWNGELRKYFLEEKMHGNDKELFNLAEKGLMRTSG